MRKIILLIVLILNGIILNYSCKKDEQEPEFDKMTSEDNALAESIFNDVNTMASQATETGNVTTYRTGKNAAGSNMLFSNCATVTLVPDSSGPGGNITIDFGPSNCYCNDFRYRRGVINVGYSGAYHDSGTQINITFNDYFVGIDTSRMFKVTGSKTVTNQGRNANGHEVFSIFVDGHLTNSTGAIMNWTSTRTREWTAGDNTPINWLDDEYVISGSAGGTNFEGHSYTMTITQGLRIALNCPYVKQGTFELTPTGLATRIFDYGDGSCDNHASVTINGTTFPVTLR